MSISLLGWIGIALLAIIVVFFLVAFTHFFSQEIKKELKNTEVKSGEIKKIIIDNPGKIAPMWELSVMPLEEYRRLNILQLNTIFRISMAVMLGGFLIIFFGVAIIISGRETGNQNPAIVVTLAGLITEFIGATFLFLYKSVKSDSEKHIRILERFNTVGAAMHIIDSMSPESEELKSKTKAEVSQALIQSLIKSGSESS